MVEHYVDTLGINRRRQALIDDRQSLRRQIHAEGMLFARSMAAEPVIFLADEPTRGVDAGARIRLLPCRPSPSPKPAPA